MKINASNKKHIKDALKEWLDNFNSSYPYYDNDATFHIFYNDGTSLTINDLFYQGNKVPFQNIANIIYICSECEFDFFYDCISDIEAYKECYSNTDYYKNPLIVTNEQKEAYYSKWETSK